MAQPRGSIWANKSKKAGFSKSIGAYGYRLPGAKDRYFILTTIRGSKTRVYESPEAAIRDGWFIVQRGK